MNFVKVYRQLESEPSLADVPCYFLISLWGDEVDKTVLNVFGPQKGWRMNQEMVIPKVIHYTWFGNEPLPKEHLANIETWRRYCPDYEIIEWTESNYDYTKHHYMKAAYEAKAWGFVPDYARLDIVLEYGGIYLDLDVEVIKPLDELLYNDAYFGFEDTYLVNLGSGFGAVKGFPLIKELRDAYDETPAFLADGTFDLKPSPFHQTESFKGFGLVQDGSFQIIKGAAVYPARYLAGKNPKTGRLIKNDDTFSLHHYVWSWVSEGEREEREEARRLMELATALD
jgi:hypothetical protein